MKGSLSEFIDLENALRGALFSDHYLKDRLRKTADFQKIIKNIDNTFTEIKEDYEDNKDILSDLNEASLEDQFLNPVLSKLGHSKAVRHMESPILSHKGVEGKPDYVIFQNEEEKNRAVKVKDTAPDEYFDRAVGIIEAKKWGKDLDKGKETPSVQIKRYLRLAKVSWGILTNGKKWRIYTMESKFYSNLYLEFDIQNIINFEKTSLFEYFYAFLSHQAFVKEDEISFLDKIYKRNIRFAREVKEDLDENVYKALKVLAEGFLNFSKNNLVKKDLDTIHQNCLILLYRLLFLFYAESKGLINFPEFSEGYSLLKISEEVADDDKHYAPLDILYWQKLRTTFDIVNRGSKEVLGAGGVPAYNGGLFDPEEHRFLAEHQIGNNYLKKAINFLARRKSKRGHPYVDYETLQIKHLGSIYEKLLEYNLEVAEKPLGHKNGKYYETTENDEIKVKKGEVYLTTDRGKRRATGSYYTPNYIVQYIVKNTVGEFIENKIEKAQENGESEAEAILEVKILDPAMGSGHFLVDTTEFMAEELVEAINRDIGNGLWEKAEKDQEWAKREIVKNCIYGVDKNPLATELAKVSLWLKTVSKNKPLSFLDHHLKTGNSLFSADFNQISHHPTIKREEERKTKFLLPEILKKENIDVGEVLKETFNPYTEIKDISEEVPEDIHKKMRLYEKFQEKKLYRRLNVLADVYTSYFFGNAYSEQQYEKLKNSLMKDKEWNELIKEDWVKKASNYLPKNLRKKNNISEEKKFFHWPLEFPEIFLDLEKGKKKVDPGFDVVIGNPPYLPWYMFKDEGKFYKRGRYRRIQYKCRPNHDDSQPNYYLLFGVLASDLTKKDGISSYIIPQEWMERPKAQDFRDHFLLNANIEIDVFDKDFKVFKTSDETIGTNSMILFLKGNKKGETVNARFVNTTEEAKVKDYLINGNVENVSFKSRKVDNLLGNKWVFQKDVTEILSDIKEEKNVVLLGSDDFKIGGGFQPPTDLIPYYTIEKEKVSTLSEKEKKYVYPAAISSKRLKRYYIENLDKYWILLNDFDNLKNAKKEASNLVEIVKKEKDTLEKDHEKWWSFPRIRNFSFLKHRDTKLMTPRTAKRNSFALDDKKTMFKGTNAFVCSLSKLSDWELLGLLNSKLLTCWQTFKGSDYHGHNRYEPGKLKNIPIKTKGKHISEIGKIAKEIQNKKEQFYSEVNSFLEWISRWWNCEIESLSLKTHLREYWEYDFDEMLRIAKKNKSKLPKDPSSRTFQERLEEEWHQSLEVLTPLIKEIQKFNHQVDAMVFDLYGLSEEERKVILDSINSEDTKKMMKYEMMNSSRRENEIGS